MGSLRFILAVSVLLAHSVSGILPLVGGKLAVQIFYVLSGYLISYILVEKKYYATNYSFFLSRILRLYPIYFVVMVLTFISYCYGSGKFFNLYTLLPAGVDIWLVISNIFIFGQDLIMFTAFRNGNLIFPDNFQYSDLPIYKGLLVPQAWTLCLELTFYLLSPLILHRLKFVILGFVLSFTIKCALLLSPIGDIDPWSYRFFPAELFLFLGGAISQQLLTKRLLYATNCKAVCIFFTLLVLIIIVTFPLIPLDNLIKELLVIAVVFATLPFLFAFENHFQFDKRLAELSYPVYINHIFVIIILQQIMLRFTPVPNPYMPYFVLAASVSGAILLNKFISEPVDILRHRLRDNLNKTISTD